MKKEKSVYRYCRFNGSVLHAKREIPYEIKLYSKLVLDELCFNWNKEKLEVAINSAIDSGNREAFYELSKVYSHFIWE
ncbi:IDEAL domain-containing protein [Virgibacillus sp. C22-A2]|uniref:IDEAL domain-containing protein n=1 Tax=Virgibacillus tibetensis TaxID=3042313 RepID=A0ABU6KEG1_9BACI|nr:IDEAL domain-containing protein [Virgibacillus sp. C22-A2]